MSLLQSANFPNDREYTFNALVEEIALAERHIRDGSWSNCTCNPEKHLPIIAGLASEGYIFAESPKERMFMAKIRNDARRFKAGIKNKTMLNQGDMDAMADWGRDARHKIEAREWNSSPVTNTVSNPSSSYFPLYNSKRLNEGNNYSRSGEYRMKTKTKEVVKINAAQWIAKFASLGYVEIDKLTGQAIAPVHMRPSTWLNIGVGLGVQLLTLWKKVGPKWDIPLVVFGSQQLTKLADYAAEAIGPSLGITRVSYTPPGVQSTTYRATYPASNGTVQVTRAAVPVGPRYTIVA